MYKTNCCQKYNLKVIKKYMIKVEENVILFKSNSQDKELNLHQPY